ncbi:MAG TPA: hypothetical protein VD887_01885 [Allosphingosinicella sp.]|nr:hypothetical protein [Allosphingosinicella sp.]
MIAIAALLLATATAADEPPPPPAVAAALQAWGQCLSDGIDGADSALSPDRAAQAVLDGCATLQANLVAEHRRWVDSSSMSDAEKRRARLGMDRSLGSLRAQVARGIRRMRED